MIKRITSYYKRHREVISIFAGAIGLLFGVIQYFYPYSSDPKLHYYIRDKINVLNISEGIDKIDLYLNKRDIRKDSLNLVLYKIRLKNEGQRSVSEGDYASIPFGLKIAKGSIVSLNYFSPDLYLKESIGPRLGDSTELLLNKCIFDEGHYVDLEILVIHKLSQRPEFSSFGKIANVESIIVEEGKGEDTDWIGLVEVIVVVFLILAAVGLFFSALEEGFNWIQRYIRRRFILAFYDYPLNPLNGDQRVIVNIIAEVGVKTFKKFFFSILQTLGSYKEVYQREMDNKTVVDKMRALIKSKEYEIEKTSTEKIVDYDSDALFIIEEIEENECVDSQNKKLTESFLHEVTEVVSKFK